MCGYDVMDQTRESGSCEQANWLALALLRDLGWVTVRLIGGEGSREGGCGGSYIEFLVEGSHGGIVPEGGRVGLETPNSRWRV
jgi:hypothetical protein